MSDSSLPTQTRRGGKRDGLFQRNGWWWLDYYDAEGIRHRQKAAPDYDTAKKLYREKMTSIAKGEFLGVKEEGISLKRFVEDKDWPTIKGSLSVSEAQRSRLTLDKHLLPASETANSPRCARKRLTAGSPIGWNRPVQGPSEKK